MMKDIQVIRTRPQSCTKIYRLLLLLYFEYHLLYHLAEEVEQVRVVADLQP
jgi:hypothetical protein